jgi:hypothetical protein
MDPADVRLQTADNSQDQRTRSLCFGRDAAGSLKHFCGADRLVADNLMEEQQKQRGRGRGRPFEKGQSGNPTGRPPGTGKRAIQAMQLLLDGEAQALTRKAVELALDGNTTALRMCLHRIEPPRRERAVPLKLPPVRDAGDLAGTMTAIIAAAGEGAISPDEGGRLARLVEIFLRAVETRDFERRLQLLENDPLTPPY